MAIIDIQNLRKEYGVLAAVNDVNMQIDQGQIVGLIGPNGAGKTTLLRMLATLLTSTKGVARILQYDIQKDYLKIRKKLGYLPDFFNLYNDLTLEECLRFFAASYDIPSNRISEKIDTALRQVNLEDKRYSLIRHLSRGMIQRIGLATLLVRDPDVFLLDEPASGLDPMARIELREILRALGRDGKTIIISSHILTELSGFCTHIAIMQQGRVVRYGAVDDIRENLTTERIVAVSVLNDCDRATELIQNADLPAEVTGRVDSTLTLKITGGRENIAAVNDLLVKNDIKVYAVVEEKMDIEALFMKISSQQQEQPIA